MDSPSDSEANDLRALLNSFGLDQHVNGATHFRGHTLDLVISRATDNLVHSCEVGHFVSDHNTINIALRSGPLHPIRKHITFRKFKAIDLEKFSNDIEASALVHSLPSDVDDMVSCYNKVLKELLDKHAPSRTQAIAYRPLQPWMNDAILEARRNRRKAERLYRKGNTIPLRQSYKHQCEVVKDLVGKAKKSYYLKEIDDCEKDQKQLFKIVDKLLGRGKSSVLPEHTDAYTLAQMLNEFFITKISNIRNELATLESSIPQLHCPPLNSLLVPSSSKLLSFKPTTSSEVMSIINKSSKSTCSLDPIPTSLLHDVLPTLAPVIADLVNAVLATGVFPAQLKSAIVLPLLKKVGSDPDVLKNYRPVSNLAFISKIIEKVVAARLIEHLSSNGLMDQYQSAYRKGHSTQTALVRVHDDIVSAVDKGCGVCLILLDLSAAFDTVDHTILCTFLENHIGLGGHALDFFKSYLADRTQCVSVKGVMSEMIRLIYGVPQGSVLGPIEFCIYTLPLSAILKHYKIDYHIYADDTQIYCSFDAESLDEVLGSLDNCISDIRSWMITNNSKLMTVRLNSFSSHHLGQKFTKDIQITIGQSNISPSSTCKSLGVMLDDHFAMDAHISNICRSTHFHIRNIGAIRDLLTISAAAKMVHSLVTSRVDYCNALLLGVPDYKIKRLQRMHNIAARIVARPPHDHDIDEVLKSLHWLPVKSRILFKSLLLVYKCENGLAPEYLSSLLVPYVQERYGLRSNDLDLLSVPSADLKSYGHRAFSFGAVVEWNKLPLDLRHSPSVAVFKSRLKTYLFEKCYA